MIKIQIYYNNNKNQKIFFQISAFLCVIIIIPVILMTGIKVEIYHYDSPVWYFFVFYLILTVVYINYYHDFCFSVPAITTSTGLQLVQSKGLLIKSITIFHQTFQ